MPTVDTNVLLRWMLDDVPELTPRADLIITKPPKCVVPNEALIEVVYVLERVIGASRPAVAQSLETLFAVANVAADRELWTQCLTDYLGHPKLSIVDVFLAAQAVRARKIPLYTFDGKLAKQIEVAELPPRYQASGKDPGG